MLAQTEATDMVDVAAAIAAATTTPNWQLAGNVTDDIICPSPLVQDPAWPRYSKVAHCINGCCIPCPMTNAFYPPNRLEIGFRIATLIRGVSGLLMLFLLVSYLILPNKRKYPTSLIFFSIISLMAFCIPSFFVLTDPKKIQCTDEITQSTMSNNIACGIQGAILIFGSFGACLWIAAVILNLHLHTVWNSQWMSKHYKWIVAIGWIYCAAGAAVPLAMNIVQYDYAELCLVSKEKSGIFFWPLGAVVFPAVFLHVWTFIYIIRVRRNARGHTSPGSNPSSHGAVIRAQKMLVMETVRLQWRAMLLSVALTSALIFYWIFYFVEIRRTTQSHSTEALPAWFKCIAAGRGQSECASIMAPELPSYQIMIAAEIAVSIQGVTFFLIFGMQRRLFSEWRMYLGRQSARRSAIKTVSQRHSRFANKSISNGHTTTLMTSNNPWEDKSLESPLPTPTKRRNSTLMSDLMEVPESLPDSMDRLTRATLDSDYYVYDAEEYSRPDVMPLSDMPHLQNNHSTTTTTTTSSYLRSAPSSGSLSTISNNGMEPSPSVVPSSYSTPSNAAGYGTTGVQRNFSPTSTTFHQTYLTPNYQHHDSRTMNMDYSQQHQHQHQQQYTNDHDDMATTTTTTTNSDNDPSLAPSYRGPRFGGLARAVSQQFGHVEPNGQLPPVPPPRIYQAPR
ncbi:hypothetical protein BDF22DRAFT_671350 [Syncephalis plumigaleata]|nr:hypothetical protein BDF22DRAFT_671350 [Syncephalis plumigaleata]